MKRTLLCLLAAGMLARPAFADSTRPLLPLPAGNTPHLVSVPADPNHFVFAVAGDNRSTGRGIPAPPTAAQIFAEMRLLQPAFALWTGDTIYGSDDSPGEAEAEYETFLSAAALAETPIYNAPGNHEIYNRPELAALYEKKMGRLYGSFNYGNAHLIALNTEEPGIKGGISKAQMDWLTQDLAANKSAKNIMVFTHHPLFPKEEKEGFDEPALRDELHKMFVTYGVKNVFSGHEHLFYKSVHDGITYWVTGGAGAPTSLGPEEGGYQHFLRIEVSDTALTVTVLEPWRLFASGGPTLPNGSTSGVLTNYDAADLPMYLELSANAIPAGALASASTTYKGKTKSLAAEILPSRAPGVITVRVVVPQHRSVLVTLAPKAEAAK